MRVSKLRSLVSEILEDFQITEFEALQIAVKICEIEAYEDANVVGRTNAPTALEAISMSLDGLANAISTLEFNSH